jgi:PTH1 family peptidyl-tRNA hydrolase
MSLKGPHLIVGLGNPGANYANTRHNAGFWVIDGLAEELGINYWKLSASALVGEGSYKGEKVVLVKPQSFMNLSGGPVKGVISRLTAPSASRLAIRLGLAARKEGRGGAWGDEGTRFGAARGSALDAGEGSMRGAGGRGGQGGGFSLRDGLLVVHDELDLPAGTLRLKLGGGHGGHNGLRSLHEALGPDYARLRIGIGRPLGRMNSSSWVLAPLKGDELKEFAVTCAQAVTVAMAALTDGLTQAMNTYNRDGRSNEQSHEEPSQGSS